MLHFFNRLTKRPLSCSTHCKHTEHTANIIFIYDKTSNDQYCYISFTGKHHGSSQLYQDGLKYQNTVRLLRIEQYRRPAD